MKILNFRVGQTKTFGLLRDDGVVDLGLRLSGRFRDVRDIITPEGLEFAKLYVGVQPDYDVATIEYLPVIDKPERIFGVGMNYIEKRIEFSETNPAPTLFIRLPHSQTGHNCPIRKPLETAEFDYEGELAVVIGEPAYRISSREAYSKVAGYSCYMDGSVRDWQHSWFTAGKNWPQTGGFGPWLVTRDEIEDPHDLSLTTWLNGKVVQNESTGKMIHKISDIIAYISTFSPLAPGDVILTGSPGGVGKKRVPPVYLRDGDVVEVEIESVGRLRNIVKEEGGGIDGSARRRV
ncbi:fumarylacetoacetate hydrolase family protein [Caballeronia sp. LP003]|uniref:fumarylacetoacetate hydrolase family protein n=1 Tax=Caballeronia sp. LP003 TaxID=3038551 RepID=UPI002866243B|nr:fumarylacetoacetate hydrolase family protein [Caballeronia sp. LP003]MDR5785454.1 fumarylacetoacetate hydrolase family protein [Caballeronia sp. LP003]